MGTYERRFAQLATVPLLIVDDFGLKPLRPPEDEELHAVDPGPVDDDERLLLPPHRAASS